MNIVKRKWAVSLMAFLLIGGSGVLLSTAQASECILYTNIDGVTTEVCGAESDAILSQVQKSSSEEKFTKDHKPRERESAEAAPRGGVFGRIYSALGGRG